MRIALPLFLTSLVLLAGCATYGPEPQTVDFVDLERYAGLWHQIAANEVFFNKDLVGVTAEYRILDAQTVSVLNTGYRKTVSEENKTTISGKATVVDTATNSKLKVKFSRFPTCLFPGKYWIVLLDDENYEYAVVTDKRQFTLFILCREPEMSEALYDSILEQLRERKIDLTRLKVTGSLT